MRSHLPLFHLKKLNNYFLKIVLLKDVKSLLKSALCFAFYFLFYKYFGSPPDPICHNLERDMGLTEKRCQWWKYQLHGLLHFGPELYHLLEFEIGSKQKSNKAAPTNIRSSLDFLSRYWPKHCNNPFTLQIAQTKRLESKNYY
jgi:hypothetical protein